MASRLQVQLMLANTSIHQTSIVANSCTSELPETDQSSAITYSPKYYSPFTMTLIHPS